VYKLSPCAPILIEHALKPNSLSIHQSTTGRAEVLDKLMPTISLRRSLARTCLLSQVDDYMLLETQQLLQRLLAYYRQLGLREDEYLLEVERKRLVIKNNLGELTTLSEQANTDKCNIDIFSWLQPNYLGLIHSLELRQFAQCYQQNKTQAIAQYGHFELPNNGLSCKLIYRTDSLTLCWESPQHRFYLP
jgi:hypothetical protein